MYQEGDKMLGLRITKIVEREVGHQCWLPQPLYTWDTGTEGVCIICGKTWVVRWNDDAKMGFWEEQP